LSVPRLRRQLLYPHCHDNARPAATGGCTGSFSLWLPLRPTTRLLGSNPFTLVQKDRPVGSCSGRFCRVLLGWCVLKEQGRRIRVGACCSTPQCLQRPVHNAIKVFQARRTRYSVQRSRRARPSERPLVGSVMMHCIFCALLTSGLPVVCACVGCTCCELAVFNSAHPCLGDTSAARLLRYGYAAVKSLFLFLTLSLHRPLSRDVSLNLSPFLSPSLCSSHSVSLSLSVG